MVCSAAGAFGFGIVRRGEFRLVWAWRGTAVGGVVSDGGGLAVAA